MEALALLAGASCGGLGVGVALTVGLVLGRVLSRRPEWTYHEPPGPTFINGQISVPELPTFEDPTPNRTYRTQRPEELDPVSDARVLPTVTPKMWLPDDATETYPDEGPETEWHEATHPEGIVPVSDPGIQ